MRWESLFADLESQLAAQEAAQLAGEVADRTRREAARLRLVDRLRGVEGAEVAAGVHGAGVVRGRLSAIGTGWLLVEESGGREALVPMAALLTVSGLSARSAEPGSEGVVARRLDLGYALRGVARGRAAVLLTLVDGMTVSGTLDRVGADFVELTEHAPGELRRPGSVRGSRAVAVTAIAVIRSV